MAAPFTAEQQQKFDDGMAKAIAHFPEGKESAAVLPGLHLVQELIGWLPPEAMLQVAEKCKTNPERVREVATFYVMYWTAPKGKFVIDVCTNISCSLRGAERLVERLEKLLDVELGGTTKDQLITLREFECLGACGNAPVLQVNSRFHMDMTLKKTEALVEELRKQGGKA